MDVHKGRTTRTPWDPVLVQKTIATSPASQAGSTKYCSRKYQGREPTESAARPNDEQESRRDAGDLALEQELEAELDEARRSSADHVAECGAVNISVNCLRAEKLRVVEGVECFDAELE